MEDYIVFTVGTNFYALNVANVERIIQMPSVTAIPNAHSFVDGMMSYEKRVTKVVNFRKMTAMTAHEEEIHNLFKRVAGDHQAWVDTFMAAMENNTGFALTTDPHACRLGKWLDNYSTHDSDVLAVLKVLRPTHTKLHERGREILALRETNPAEALDQARREIVSIFSTTLAEIHKMGEMSQSISRYMQKLLIYQAGESFFAIKVDGIDDIAQIEPSMIKSVDSTSSLGEFLETSGVVEMGERLVNVIKSVSMPVKEVA
ncbi:MAG: chemotaxis protein CheW [Sulfuricurvum sp.]|nr:chemotaxis protein CheW [Sulfuricurvum sp.]MDD5386954.1 chemotaxis protein CheW [Sulfuricurvum sp.]